jgi:pyrrolidone-carboxylate peptidase
MARKNKQILVFGFKPWGKVAENVSEQVVGRLKLNLDVTTRVLATRFDETQLIEVAEEQDYNYVLGLGRYPRGNVLRLEQKGFNRKKEAGQITPIDSQDKPFYEVTWRIKPRDLAQITNDPGSYVCNFSIYIMSKWATAHHKKFAFIHIPKDFAVGQAVDFVEQVLGEVRDGVYEK